MRKFKLPHFDLNFYISSPLYFNCISIYPMLSLDYTMYQYILI